MTTSSSPVLTTACQTPAGMRIASPSPKATAPSSSRSSPDPGDDVGHLLRLVAYGLQLRAGREDGVAERAPLPLREHPRPAPAGQLDRLDLGELDDVYDSTHSPSSRMYVPSSSIHIVASRNTPSRWSERDVLAARIRVVVVAERQVHRADATLLGGRPERCLVTRAERELADDLDVLDALDRLAQPLGLLAALDPHAPAALERPADRIVRPGPRARCRA